MLTLYLSLVELDDQRKVEEIYIQYRQQMFYVACRILQDESLEEDAVRQAFLRIIDNLSKIDEDSCHKTRALVVTIVENIAIDIYRRRKRELSLSMEELESYLGEEELVSSLDLGPLEKAMTKLPLLYSTVLRLKYAQGYDNAEIAEIIGISEAGVRQRLKRGRDALQHELEKGEELNE